MAALCEPIEFGDDPTALYHLYNVSDEVIYIGVTVAPAKRMEKHADESSWWPEVAKRTMVWYPTRDEACEAETAAIQAEKPKHNQKQRSNPNSVRPGRRVRADDAERAVAYETGLPVELFPGGPVRRRITAENAGMRWSAQLAVDDLTIAETFTSVAQASEDIGQALINLQREHGLTDAEMLLAVFAWERGKVEDMLRAERHPSDPSKSADEE